jgi:hypothetical protein
MKRSRMIINKKEVDSNKIMIKDVNRNSNMYRNTYQKDKYLQKRYQENLNKIHKIKVIKIAKKKKGIM